MDIKLDLGKDSILKIFLSYALPATFAMLFQTSAYFVDTFFVGQYVGAEGIAAITLVMPILNLLIGFATMVGIGGVTMAGIHYGSGDFKSSNNFFNISVWVISFLCILGTIFILLFGESFFLQILNVDGITATYVSEYSMSLAYFFLPFLIAFVLSFFLKLDGKPVFVVVVSLSGVFLNFFLDYYLIGVLGLGMKGAAFATGLSQVIPFIIFVIAILVKSNFYFAIPHFTKKAVGRIIYNGSSELFGMISLSIAGFVYNTIIINRIGTAGVSAYGIALQVASIGAMLFYGISDSIQSPVSFNYGAKQFDRVAKFRNIAICTSLVIGILTCILTIMFGTDIANVFVNDENVINLSGYIMIFVGISAIVSGVNINVTTYYTAIDQPLISIILAVSRSLVGLLIGLLIFPNLFPEIGLWLPIIFTEIITIILVIYFLKYQTYGKVKKI